MAGPKPSGGSGQGPKSLEDVFDETSAGDQVAARTKKLKALLRTAKKDQDELELVLRMGLRTDSEEAMIWSLNRARELSGELVKSLVEVG